MASNSGPGSSANQSHWNQVQSNVAKTMVLICALYVIMCTPENVYYLLINVSTVFTLQESAYNVSVFTSIAFLYIGANPFIYAAKFEPVKRVLVGLIPCKKPQQADWTHEMTWTGTVHTRRYWNFWIVRMAMFLLLKRVMGFSCGQAALPATPTTFLPLE